MPDVDILRELTNQIRRPQFGDLVEVSRQRRRRSTLGAALGVSALVVVVTLAADALPDGQRALEPAHPTPTVSHSPSPSLSTEWTPERFRAEGAPTVLIAPTTSGLSATQYVACSGTCQGELSNRALEVTQGGQSAVFEVRGIGVSWAPVWVTVFDEDSVLVQDAAQVGRPDGPVRYRLLQADGTASELEVVDDPVPAVPGPEVFVIDPYAAWSSGMVGPGDRQRLYFVDDRAGSLRPLDVPQEVHEWGPNVDEYLWGTNGCRVIWQRPDGGFDHHDVDCGDPGLASLPDDYWGYLDDWAEPGRMVLLEHNADGVPLVVHASLDRGATWERIQIGDRKWDGTIAQGADAIVDALGQLG